MFWICVLIFWLFILFAPAIPRIDNDFWDLKSVEWTQRQAWSVFGALLLTALLL
jgi:hypothetical protein